MTRQFVFGDGRLTLSGESATWPDSRTVMTIADPESSFARAVAMLVVAVTTSVAGARAESAQNCRAEPVATMRAERATGPHTFLLSDKTEMKLAGIEPPYDREDSADAAKAATAALERLVAGRDVSFSAASTSDRYGRKVAFVWAHYGVERQSVQHSLLAQGHARVGVGGMGRGCTNDLFAAESGARTAKLGLWANSYYELNKAEDAAAILKQRGRFAVVEGKVLSVRESGGAIYVNFGRRWSEDFTLTVLKRNERVFAAAGVAPKTLERRRVRVRGFVEERGGPWIEAISPDQIEVVEGN